jgi:hypothetical protein
MGDSATMGISPHRLGGALGCSEKLDVEEDLSDEIVP